VVAATYKTGGGEKKKQRDKKAGIVSRESVFLRESQGLENSSMYKYQKRTTLKQRKKGKKKRNKKSRNIKKKPLPKKNKEEPRIEDREWGLSKKKKPRYKEKRESKKFNDREREAGSGGKALGRAKP